MRISKGLRLAVVAGLLASAAACGGSGDSGGGNSGGKVELTLLSHYSDGPSKDGLDKMIAQWNKGNPKIQVKAQVVKFDRKDIKVHHSPVDLMIREIGDRKSLIVFPEGGRSPDGSISEFKSGLYYLSKKRPDLELVPVHMQSHR